MTSHAVVIAARVGRNGVNAIPCTRKMTQRMSAALRARTYENPQRDLPADPSAMRREHGRYPGKCSRGACDGDLGLSLEQAALIFELSVAFTVGSAAGAVGKARGVDDDSKLGHSLGNYIRAGLFVSCK